MPDTIPSTSELTARNLANLESRLGATTPSADKAYNKVLAVSQGMTEKGLYAFAADRAKANLAISAPELDLEYIGIEYDCERNPASQCVLAATLPCESGTIIPINSIFDGPQGLQYQTTAEVTASGTSVSLPLICTEAGTSGNLAIGDELTMQETIDGAESTATVTAITTTAVDKEDLETYRQRVLDKVRADGGGGNSSDIREWGESVAGVKRVYPFTGKPYNASITAYPGMRTVYVEATKAYQADGIADGSLVALVKAAILADPDTGKSREILGLTSDTLYVQSIARTPIYVEIAGLSVRLGTSSAAMAAVNTALTAYMITFRPFVQGLDPDFDRLDKLVRGHLARVTMNVLDDYQATVTEVKFGISVGTYLDVYALADGETLKLGGITWVS
jgi:hypothetical protein